jgi:hypothetical protein
MAQRIKGQEVVVGFTSPDGDQKGLEDVVSFEAELDIETLQEAYLGKVSDDYDDIFHGVTGQMEIHMRSSQYLAFTQKVQDRAQRRSSADGQFTATATFNFPDGTRARLTFEDLFFGALPIKVSGRAAYVSGTIQWKCSDMRRVL